MQKAMANRRFMKSPLLLSRFSREVFRFELLQLLRELLVFRLLHLPAGWILKRPGVAEGILTFRDGDLRVADLLLQLLHREPAERAQVRVFAICDFRFAIFD